MKYVMMKFKSEGKEHRYPVIFPTEINHDEMSEALQNVIAKHFEIDEDNIECVNAGSLNSEGILSVVHGHSGSLGIPHDDIDTLRIFGFDKTNGIENVILLDEVYESRRAFD